MAKTAIVTGASGGIGGAIPRLLVADGFSVVAHYSGNSAKADEAVEEIKKARKSLLALMNSLRDQRGKT